MIVANFPRRTEIRTEIRGEIRPEIRLEIRGAVEDIILTWVRQLLKICKILGKKAYLPAVRKSAPAGRYTKKSNIFLFLEHKNPVKISPSNSR